MKERPLLQLYLIYVVTLGAAAFAVYITMHTVAKPLFLAGSPSFKFGVLVVVIMLTPMPIFILVSLPALFVFWMLLRRFEYGICLVFIWA